MRWDGWQELQGGKSELIGNPATRHGKEDNRMTDQNRTIDLAALRQMCAVVANPDSEFTLEITRRTLANAVPQLLDELAAATERAEAAQSVLTRAVNESGHTKFCRLYQDIGECDCWYGAAWDAVAIAGRDGGETR